MKKRYNHCTITYDKEDGVVVIDMISVPKKERGKGYATLAMTEFVKKFKNEQIELHAYDQDDTMDNNQLKEWYERFGFCVVEGNSSDGYEMRY